MLSLLVLWRPSVATAQNKFLARKFPPLFHKLDKKKDLKSWKVRKEYLKKRLQGVVYGYFPDDDYVTNFNLVKSIPDEKNNLRYEEYKLTFSNLSESYYINLALFIPDSIEASGKKNSVVLTLNKCGNQSVWKENYVTWREDIKYHPKCYKKKVYRRNSYGKSYHFKELINKGFIVATISESDIRTDNGKLYKSGFHRVITTGPDRKQSWGALTSWAWGLQRAVDALIEHPLINKDKIVLFGHSRRGKAALLASAFDERISMVIPHQSGTGGVAPFRGSFGRESARGMVGYGFLRYNWIGEPHHLAHFFAPGFQQIARFNNQFEIDTHQVLALIAPRKIFDIQGSRDFWAGPRDSFKNLKRVQPIYDLYGKPGVKFNNCYRTYKYRLGKGQCDLLPKNPNYEILGDVFQIRRKKGHNLDKDDWKLIAKILKAFNY